MKVHVSLQRILVFGCLSAVVALAILIQRFDKKLTAPDPEMSTPQAVYLIGFPATAPKDTGLPLANLTDGFYRTSWKVNSYTGEKAALEMIIRGDTVIKRLLMNNHLLITGEATAVFAEGTLRYRDIEGPEWLFPPWGETLIATSDGFRQKSRDFVWLSVTE